MVCGQRRQAIAIATAIALYSHGAIRRRRLWLPTGAGRQAGGASAERASERAAGQARRRGRTSAFGTSQLHARTPRRCSGRAAERSGSGSGLPRSAATKARQRHLHGAGPPRARPEPMALGGPAPWAPATGQSQARKRGRRTVRVTVPGTRRHWRTHPAAHYTNSGALEKNGPGGFLVSTFCLKLDKPHFADPLARPSARSLALKALIAAVRPLAGTLSAGSLAAKALIAAARA
jgi:hypothetical protein